VCDGDAHGVGSSASHSSRSRREDVAKWQLSLTPNEPERPTWRLVAPGFRPARRTGEWYHHSSVNERSILIVDDNQDVLELARRYLTRRGFDVTTMATVLGVTATVMRLRPDVVVLDVDVPAIEGGTLAGLIRREVDVPIVLYTAMDEEIARAIAARFPRCHYVPKAIGVQHLHEALLDLCDEPDLASTVTPPRRSSVRGQFSEVAAPSRRFGDRPSRTSQLEARPTADETPTLPPPPMSLDRVIEEVESVRPCKKESV